DHRGDINRYAGMVELATGHPDRAVERLRSAVALTESNGRHSNSHDAHACLLGVALAETGRTGEAAPMLGEACSRYASLGSADPLVVQWIARARRRATSP